MLSRRGSGQERWDETTSWCGPRIQQGNASLHVSVASCVWMSSEIKVWVLPSPWLALRARLVPSPADSSFVP